MSLPRLIILLLLLSTHAARAVERVSLTDSSLAGACSFMDTFVRGANLSSPSPNVGVIFLFTPGADIAGGAPVVAGDPGFACVRGTNLSSPSPNAGCTFLLDPDADVPAGAPVVADDPGVVRVWGTKP